MIEAETLETALAELKGARPPDLICCTVYFDESKMFDLLRSVKIECAHVPVVCARILPKDISNISIEAVGIACRSLGAASFIDVPALAERYGAEGADMHLRRELFKQLGLGDA
jgi:hypothetical protein